MKLEKDFENKVSNLLANLLEQNLFLQNEDNGSIGGNDVYTMHFLWAIYSLNYNLLKPFADSALKWFQNYKDKRDDDSKAFNPHRLLALMKSPIQIETEYIESKLEVLRNHCFSKDGHTKIIVNFWGSNNTQDVLPTLIGVEIMRIAKKEWCADRIKHSFDWVREHLDEIIGSRSQTLGFFLDEMLFFEEVFGEKYDDKLQKQILDELLTSWDADTKLWENSNYQSAHVLRDIFHIENIFDCNEPLIEKIGYETLNYWISQYEEKGIDFLSKDDISLTLPLMIRAILNVMGEEYANRFIQSRIPYIFKEQIIFKKRFIITYQKLLLTQEELKKHKEPNKINVAPVWGIPDLDTKKTKKSCFVLMPFGVREILIKKGKKETFNFDSIYHKIIKPTVKKAGFECFRADEKFTNYQIIIKIWKSILEADFIIADLTTQNSNVFYELGMAHTTGKKVILITQRESHVPFDVTAIQYIIYSDKLDEKDDFKKKLKDAINFVMNN